MSERTLILVANAKAGTISTLALAGDKLTTLATSPAGGPGLPLAVDADRGLVYAGVKGSPDHLVTLRLDADSGELTIEHRTPVPDALTYLWLTAENRLLLGASYAGGAGRVWRLDEGRPTEVGSGIFHANLHCVRSSADARFAYFVSLGEDLVAQFSFSSHGELTPLDPPTAPAPSGSGSRHLILDADETNAYVMTEFSGEALHYRRDPATGVLTAAETRAGHPGDRGLKHSVIGADPVPEHLIWGSDLHLDADGTTLWCAERTAGTLTALPVTTDGTLGTAIGHVDTVPQPRTFGFLPDGTLLVLSERDAVGVRYRPTGQGRLEELETLDLEAGPNWISVVGPR